MKTEASIVVHGKSSGQEAVDAAASAYPEGVDLERPDRFECRLPWGDPRVDLVMQRLAAAGAEPRGRLGNGSGRYHFAVQRSYGKADLQGARYLRFAAKAMILGTVKARASDGVLELQSKDIRSGMETATDACGLWQVVSHRVKGLIEGAGLRRVAFREVRIMGKTGPSKRLADGFWEVISDLTLPPLGPPRAFVHGATEEEVAADFAGPLLFREGLDIPEYVTSPPEFHYSASAIREAGPFDVALTFERFMKAEHGATVGSQEFYRFCVDHRLDARLHWTPVRIDDD